MKKKVSVILTAMVLSAGIRCDIHNHSHGAHVHGEAELSLVVTDPDSFQAQFRIPAGAVFGFEHAPSSEKDKKIADEALEKFRRSPESYIRPDPALNCIVQSAAAESVVTGKNHMDISVEYVFACGKAVKGSAAEILLSAEFPEISKVRLTLITDEKQEKSTLSKDRRTAVF